MKLIADECRKLAGIKYLWLILALLLVGNAVLAYFEAQKSLPRGIDVEQIAEFFDEYAADPESMAAYREEMEEFVSQQDELLIAAMREGRDYEPERWVNRFGTDEFGDRMLFALADISAGAGKQYQKDINKVIRSAQTNLAELLEAGIPADSYECLAQARYAEIYNNLRDSVDIKFEYVTGWGDYFRYDTVIVFIFMALILFASVIFTQESVSGFRSVLRTCRRGRVQTATLKCLLMMLIAVEVVLLFTFSSFAVFGAVQGFSSAENAIQVLSDFTYCPYLISIGEYFLISLGTRLLTFMAFSGILLVISAFATRYIYVYAAGLGIVGVNFLMYSLVRISSNSLVRNINFFAGASGRLLFSRYRVCNIFGNTCSYVTLALVLLAVMLLLAVAGAVMLFAYLRVASGGSSRRILVSFRKVFSRGARQKRAPGRAKLYSLSLLRLENYKLVVASRMVAIVLAALCLRAVISVGSTPKSEDNYERILREYMLELEGELTPEKREYIRSEAEFISQTLAAEDQVRREYYEGVISYEEYRDYYADYNYAFSHVEAIKAVQDHEKYIDKCSSELGIDAWFVYDSGWLRLFGTDADVILLVLILIMLTGVFSDEYNTRSSSGGFAQILRTAKRGRAATFSAKLSSAVLTVAVLTVLFNAVQLSVICFGFNLPASEAPLQSLELFGGYKGHMSLLGFTVLTCGIRLIAALTLAVLVCGLSELLRRPLSIMSCAVALTVLPAMLAYFGIEAMSKVDFLRYFAGTPLCLDSIEVFGGFFGVIIFGTASAVLAIVSAGLAAKRFCSNNL